MKSGKFLLTCDLMAQILGLPEGNHVASISQSDTDRLHGIFNVIVVGKNCPNVLEGAEIPIITKEDLD